MIDLAHIGPQSTQAKKKNKKADLKLKTQRVRLIHYEQELQYFMQS